MMMMSCVAKLIILLCLHEILQTSASDNWISQFLRGKKSYEQISGSVEAGARIGLQECREQFRWDLWNCSLNQQSSRLPVFVKTILPYGNREAAFLHAITTAGIVHTLTKNCTLGNIKGCQCRKMRTQSPHREDWTWAGCSENVKFGESISRKFVDDLEKGKGARTAMNLQNNEVGRRVVRHAMKMNCKCHGVSGSCKVRTCWKTLSPFSHVGDILKRKYHKAKRMKYHDNKVYIVPANTSRGVKPLPKRDDSLIFLQPSPDYCQVNESAGSLGVYNRAQRSSLISNVRDFAQVCKHCRLNVSKFVEYQEKKCNCRFEWCCQVMCDTCREKVYSMQCTSGG